MITRPLSRPLTSALTRALTSPGAGGGGFNPASLFASGEQGAWYDPSDLSSMFQDTAGTVPVTAAGQSVARINDKSGRGNHLTQGTAGSRPTYQVDGSGNGHLLFDGTNDSMTSASSFNLSGSDKAFVSVAVYVAGTGNQGLIATATAGAGRGDLIYLSGASPPPRAGLTGSTGTSQVRVNAIGTAPYFAVNTATLDIAGATATDEIVARQNGAVPAQTVAAAGPAGAGNFGNGTFVLGDLTTAATFPFNGRVYGVIVRGGASSSAQVGDAETYLADKAGIVF